MARWYFHYISSEAVGGVLASMQDVLFAQFARLTVDQFVAKSAIGAMINEWLIIAVAISNLSLSSDRLTGPLGASRYARGRRVPGKIVSSAINHGQ